MTSASIGENQGRKEQTIIKIRVEINEIEKRKKWRKPMKRKLVL